jgi:hypothetical protein
LINLVEVRLLRVSAARALDDNICSVAASPHLREELANQERWKNGEWEFK